MNNLNTLAEAMKPYNLMTLAERTALRISQNLAIEARVADANRRLAPVRATQSARKLDRVLTNFVRTVPAEHLPGLLTIVRRHGWGVR